MNEEVILMFAVFILFFLIPLIPAIVIYKLFPKSEVETTGPFKGLTIKAKGAFGAYIIALVSGVFIINSTIDMINESVKSKNEKVDYLWEVRSNLRVLQDDSSEADYRDLLDNLEVNLQPAPIWHRSSEDGFIVYVPNKLIEGNVTIAYSAPQCETKKINPNSANYKRDDLEKKIEVGDLMIRRTTMPNDSYKLRSTLTPTDPPPVIAEEENLVKEGE